MTKTKATLYFLCVLGFAIASGCEARGSSPENPIYYECVEPR